MEGKRSPYPPDAIVTGEGKTAFAGRLAVNRSLDHVGHGAGKDGYRRTRASGTRRGVAMSVVVGVISVP